MTNKEDLDRSISSKSPKLFDHILNVREERK